MLTIEDSVEYEIDGINQIEVNLGHGLTFSKGVKTSLRMDPDCLMVGEIRETETASQALSSSVMAHVMMATTHSRDAVSTVTRLRNFGVADHQIAVALGVVVNQRLVGRLCKHCIKQRDITEEEKDFFKTRSMKLPAVVSDTLGCDECDDTGIEEGIGIFEVWNLDQIDYEMILVGEDEESIRAKLAKSSHEKLL